MQEVIIQQLIDYFRLQMFNFFLMNVGKSLQRELYSSPQPRDNVEQSLPNLVVVFQQKQPLFVHLDSLSTLYPEGQRKAVWMK